MFPYLFQLAPQFFKLPCQRELFVALE